jgi:catechol 2,3-dioxygenase-like lactoylglutathione lyase family enzyme
MQRLTPKMLNHAAWVTHDVAATARFYTEVMGMELASTIMGDNIPSTGAPIPYFHIFFRMRDGSTLAFFECPGLPQAQPAGNPAYGLLNHTALHVDTADEVHAWKKWLNDNGVETVGPTNHDDMLLSVYFYDPNGYRLEITAPLDPAWNRHGERGQRDLDAWLDAKQRAIAEGRDVREAMLELIREPKRHAA